MFFECVGFSYVVLDLVYSVILPSNWLARPCPNDSYVEEFNLHKDQLLQDPLTFKQNSSYELVQTGTVHMNCFGFFHYIFRFVFTVLVVHPYHYHPITTVLTHYSPMACYSLLHVLKVPLNTNQPTNLIS